MIRWRGLPVGLVLAVALAGCTAISPGSSSAGGEIEEMKRRILELERQARVAGVEIDRLRRQVAQLETGAAPSASPAAGRQAPARSEATPTTEREEPESPRPASPPDAPVESSELALENRLSEPAVRATPPPASESATQPPAATAEAPVSADALALYDRGYTFYHQGRNIDAETVLRQYLQQYGDTELADNAQYWIGEARFSRGQVAEALAAFRETFARFPKGNKVPDAMLRAGDCLARLGDTDGARAEYAEVARRFPNTAAAVMAEERRAKLP